MVSRVLNGQILGMRALKGTKIFMVHAEPDAGLGSRQAKPMVLSPALNGTSSMICDFPGQIIVGSSWVHAPFPPSLGLPRRLRFLFRG